MKQPNPEKEDQEKDRPEIQENLSEKEGMLIRLRDNPGMMIGGTMEKGDRLRRGGMMEEERRGMKEIQGNMIEDMIGTQGSMTEGMIEHMIEGMSRSQEELRGNMRSQEVDTKRDLEEEQLRITNCDHINKICQLLERGS